jgi:hypothetical protein
MKQYVYFIRVHFLLCYRRVNIPQYRDIESINFVYYINNQQGATLTVLSVSTASAVETDLGHPYWIYIIPTHDTHQWLLLQFLVLLMMDTESVRNM